MNCEGREILTRRSCSSAHAVNSSEAHPVGEQATGMVERLNLSTKPKPERQLLGTGNCWSMVVWICDHGEQPAALVPAARPVASAVETEVP